MLKKFREMLLVFGAAVLTVNFIFASSGYIQLATDDIEDVNVKISKTFLLSEAISPLNRNIRTIEIEYWPLSLVAFRCSFLSLGVNPRVLLALALPLILGCADLPPQNDISRPCLVIVPVLWNSTVVEHEIRHCEGYAHDIDDTARFLGPT